MKNSTLRGASDKTIPCPSEGKRHAHSTDREINRHALCADQAEISSMDETWHGFYLKTYVALEYIVLQVIISVPVASDDGGKVPNQ